MSTIQQLSVFWRTEKEDWMRCLMHWEAME